MLLGKIPVKKLKFPSVANNNDQNIIYSIFIVHNESCSRTHFDNLNDIKRFKCICILSRPFSIIKILKIEKDFISRKYHVMSMIRKRKKGRRVV